MWVLFTLILLGAAEALVRIAISVLGLTLDTSYGYPSSLFVEHPQRGYAYRPGFEGRFPNPPYDTIPIEINESGFRDRPFPERSERLRLIVVGDSITFGAGVRAEDRFTEVLGRRLCTKDCEVLNLGVNGYQAENYLATLREQLPVLSPDWVIVGFCMNDLQGKAGLEHIEVLRGDDALARARRIARHSQVLRLMHRLWLMATFDADAYDKRWIRLAMEAWRSDATRAHLARTLDEIRALSTRQGARLLVVLFPERHQVLDFAQYGAPYSRAETTISALGIPIISLLPALEEAVSTGMMPLEAVFLPGDNIHYTARAHAWIGALLADRLAGELRHGRIRPLGAFAPSNTLPASSPVP